MFISGNSLLINGIPGTAGQLLMSDGTNVLWATLSKISNIIGGTAGAIPYQSDVDTTAMLAPGTAGQLLMSNGNGAPSWTTLTKVQNLIGGGLGTIPYQTAANVTAMLPVGVAGTVLTSNGNAAPAWSALPNPSTDGTKTGVIKARLSGNTLYITTDGTNA